MKHHGDQVNQAIEQPGAHRVSFRYRLRIQLKKNANVLHMAQLWKNQGVSDQASAYRSLEKRYQAKLGVLRIEMKNESAAMFFRIGKPSNGEGILYAQV